MSFACLRGRRLLPLAKVCLSGRRGLASSLVDNPNLPSLAGNDYLYHIGLNPALDDVQACFKDVRFVCMGGSVQRMSDFAERAADELGTVVEIPFGLRPAAIGKTDRFTMFKVGPVLISSHGMGQPSMSILLHEVIKLMQYAGAADPTFIRLGTSGGVGVPPGSVVVTTGGVNGLLGADYQLPILGEMVSRPSVFREDVVNDVLRAVQERPETAEIASRVLTGRTMSADCFYEGQGRLDGAVCEHGEPEKMEFLRRAHACGVRNIEMESLQFGALTHRLGVRAATCCVTLLDRLQGDQVRSTPQQLQEWDASPGSVVLAYIKHDLGVETEPTEEVVETWTVAAH